MSVSANEDTRIEPSQQSIDGAGTSGSVPTQEPRVSPPVQIHQLILSTLESQGKVPGGWQSGVSSEERMGPIINLSVDLRQGLFFID
jgi:hypothetical protein